MLMNMKNKRSLRGICRGAASAAVIGVCCAAGLSPAQAKEDKYFLQFMMQSFDGAKEFSHTQTAGFARMREGDESYVLMNFGNGAVVIEKPGVIEVGNIVNTSGTEVEFSYDYDTHTMGGENDVASFFNQYVRPKLNNGPLLGQDANWTEEFTLSDIGFPSASGGTFRMDLARQYFTHEGTDYVLLTYNVPAFDFETVDGIPMVQWGKSVAIMDADMGQLFWNATLHRAVSSGFDGKPRPYRYAKTIAMRDDTGKAVLDPREVPSIARYFDEFYGASQNDVLGFAGDENAPSQAPLVLAAAIDIMGLSLAENSGNQAGETSGQYVGGGLGGAYVTVTSPVGGGMVNATEYYQQHKDDYFITSFASGSFEDMVDVYGTPDKFMAMLGGIAELEAKGEQARRYNEAVQSLTSMSYEIDKAARQFKVEGQQLKNRLSNIDRQREALERTMSTQISQMDNIDDMFDGPMANTMNRLDALDKEAKLIVAEMEAMGKEATYLVKLKKQIPAYEDAVLAMSKRYQALAPYAARLTDALSKIETPLTILGGVGNISETYQTATNLGTFDPSDKDLKLTGSYDSAYDFSMDIALNIMGIAGNAASGNLTGTVADTLTFASGRFTDLYKVYQAAEYAQGQARQAHMDYILTMMQYTLKLEEEEAKKLAALKASYKSIYTDEDPYADGYDLNNPNYDQKTGLPKPAYWAWLKKNRPQELINMGIDPNAPVGGWPADDKNGDGLISKAEADAMRQRFQDAFKPDYPTAPPRDPNKPKDEPTQTADDGSDAEPYDPTEGLDDILDDWTDTMLSMLDDWPPEDGELDNADDVAAAPPNYIDVGAGVRFYDPSSDFNVDPVTFDPVTFDPVTFDPVTFDPVTFDPVVFDPPTYVPPEFDAPDPMLIDWTNFDDDDYPGGDPNNLAFQYGNMSGKVATDLSPYAEWLATQDVRYLERLARQAGYLNLASALADWQNLIKYASDQGFRQWANQPPSCNGLAGCGPQYLERWAMKKSQVALGDILADSRDIFSTAGLSDIKISGFLLSYIMRDYSLEDGDIVDVVITQFGRKIFETRISLLNAGTDFNINLQPGVAAIEITAVNEGYASPNTAAITIDNVTEGENEQTYSLRTGETATLRVEPGQ